ncbi:hypothetical protein B9Z65_6351 [Elsinoe australis]|uniref:Uncharacterized protein n=1 Tax=Elsinoe australis TaxID=40998 RepID=A0A2P8A8E5_9PEZI|nr:hypothetical protein B9Z65_6351 [Elsinoe australis]
MAPVKTPPGSKLSPKTKPSPKFKSHPENKSPSKPKTATSDITQGTTDTTLADGVANTIASTTPAIPTPHPATLPNIDPATGIPILVDETTDWEALLTRVQSLMSQLIGALEDDTPARHTGPS